MDLFTRAILQIVVWILKMVDYIFAIFKIVAGVENVRIGDSNPMGLLNGIMAQKTITRIFIYMLLIGVAAGAIFTIYSTIKNMAVVKKTNGKIITQFLFSIMGMFVIFITIFVFIYVVGQLLGAIMVAFSTGANDANLSIGNQIIKALGESAIINGKEESYKELFTAGFNERIGIYQNDFIDKFYGILDKQFGILDYSIKEGLIDKNLFQVFIALVSACIIGYCSIASLVQLVIRIYDIIFMIMVLPLPLAAYSLDDGERFKLWKKTIISKMFLAYGTILAVNIYLLLVPLIQSINLSDNLSLTPSGSAVPNLFLLNLFKVFMIVAGGFTIAGGQLLFARIMGTDAEEGRQAQQTFRNAVAGVGSAVGIAKGAKKLVFGAGSRGASGSSPLSRSESASARGGRFSGVSSGSLASAGRTGGVIGVGANIASRFSRSLFGKGSGKALKDKVSNSRVARNIKGSKIGAQASAFRATAKEKGLIGALANSKNIKAHGEQSAKNMKLNNQIYKNSKNSTMSPEMKQQYKEFKKDQRAKEFSNIINENKEK